MYVGQRLPAGHQFVAPGLDQAQKFSSIEHIRIKFMNISQVKLMGTIFMMDKPNQVKWSGCDWCLSASGFPVFYPQDGQRPVHQVPSGA